MKEEKKKNSFSQNKKDAEKVEVQSVTFPQFDREGKKTSPLQKNSLEMLYDVPLEISVELGRTLMSIGEILRLAPGSVIELDKLAGEPLDLLVNGKLVAKGEIVVVDENFAVKITEIIGQEMRVRNLK